VVKIIVLGVDDVVVVLGTTHNIQAMLIPTEYSAAIQVSSPLPTLSYNHLTIHVFCAASHCR
jgi:hypothetical protein